MRLQNGPLPTDAAPPASGESRGVRPRTLARQLGVAPGVIYRAIADSDLPAWRLGTSGRVLVIPADAIGAWLASKEHGRSEACGDRAA
jgi:excisionase family DNA binding protein